MEFYHYILIFIGCMVVLKMIIHSCQSEAPATTKIMVCRNGEMVEFDAIVINRDIVNTGNDEDESNLAITQHSSPYFDPDDPLYVTTALTDPAHPMYGVYGTNND